MTPTGWETWGHKEDGPMLWMNWRDSLAGMMVLGSHRALLFSDTVVRGSALHDAHPYTLASVDSRDREPARMGEPACNRDEPRIHGGEPSPRQMGESQETVRDMV